MPAHFENGEKSDGTKIWASVHTIRAQFENGRKFDSKNSLQDFDAKEKYLHQSKSKSVKKCAVYIIVECSKDAVSNLYRLGFRFQHLPLSKSAGKNVPFSCEREAYPSHFAPFSKCAGIVWTQS